MTGADSGNWLLKKMKKKIILNPIAGIDEVGYGAIAGPLCLGCVVIEKGIAKGVRDSKTLSELQRVRAEREIHMNADFMHVAEISVEEINEHGIGPAWIKAFYECYDKVNEWNPDVEVICDWANMQNSIKSYPNLRFEKKGDKRFYQVAAASIVAKEYRDTLMSELHDKYPEFKFCDNKGYGTDKHIYALSKYGASDVHRTKPTEKILRKIEEGRFKWMIQNQDVKALGQNF